MNYFKWDSPKANAIRLDFLYPDTFHPNGKKIKGKIIINLLTQNCFAFDNLNLPYQQLPQHGL